MKNDYSVNDFIKSLEQTNNFSWLSSTLLVVSGVFSTFFTIYSVISKQYFIWAILFLFAVDISLFLWCIRLRSKNKTAYRYLNDLDVRLSALGKQHTNLNSMNDAVQLLMQLEEQIIYALIQANTIDEKQRLFNVYLQQVNIYNQSLLESRRMNSNG